MFHKTAPATAHHIQMQRKKYESSQPEDIVKPHDVIESPNEVIDGEHNLYIEIRTGIVRQRIMGMKDPNGQDPWVSYILGVSSGNDIRQWNHSLKVHVIREAQHLIGIWNLSKAKLLASLTLTYNEFLAESTKGWQVKFRGNSAWANIKWPNWECGYPYYERSDGEFVNAAPSQWKTAEFRKTET